jgi:uncharacterized membrane protein YphA (DoxX/SURF4 family)
MDGSPSKTGRILLLAGRVALGLIFVYAAYTKLRPAVPGPFSLDSLRLSLSLFATQVDSYQLLPGWAVSFVAHTLPFFELAIGLLLVSGWLLRSVSSVTSALMLGFFGVMLRSYALGLEINCGCFGPGEALGVKTLIRDGSLLALSLAVTFGAFWMRRSRRGVPGVISTPAPQKTD